MRRMNNNLAARIDQETRQKLETLAALEHTSDSEQLRRAISERYQRKITDRLFGVQHIEREQQPA